MKSEIKIILEDGSSNKAKGNCFEDLMRKILEIHQYEVRGNINFAGMEIDLIAKHKHKEEIVYVECKAKDKVSSDELTKFCFNTGHKKANAGYFFRTNELEFQAGALLKELKEDERYKNLTFFEPYQIIQILSDGKMIFEPLSDLKEFIISKKILAITYFGDFLIYLINESNALPTKFIAVNAKQNDKIVSQEHVDILKKTISEITNLEIGSYFTKPFKELSPKLPTESIETISEVQESENWYDYLPASSEKNHFVGRDEIRTKILSFFKEVEKSKTNKRIFYLNGRSGWGKSSLVLEVKGRCRNKHFKNRFYTLAIDTRSAISDNFVALSFKKLINYAIRDGFITNNIFSKNISFTSNVDLLSSESIEQLLSELKFEGKSLVLIFDQFEDVFRKKDYFKTFYKFLTDVTDQKPNLIIGFSWKSDFFIQSDDPSYHIWQQAKEQAREFTIEEFKEKEIDGIIKQLEGSVGSLDKSIRDRIKESSQGLPWLTKKLCIHIFDQIESGLPKEKLIESNLNISDLFKKDEERINSDEFKALKIIAKRAYDGNFFDETEVGETIDSSIITTLLHKRLIIRSGANYNIYWDIYRDYLVTNQIPTIGESYLIRQGVNLCFEVFILFEPNRKESLESLSLKHPKAISNETLGNILIELRNIGIVTKESDFYYINDNIDVSKEGFVNFITARMQNYTPYLLLKKEYPFKITKNDVIISLKSIFKQDFQDNTWDAYAKILISWFMFSNLDIKPKLIEPRKGRGNNNSSLNKIDGDIFIPKASIKEIIEVLNVLSIGDSNLNHRHNKELLYLSIVDSSRVITDFGISLLSMEANEVITILQNKILTFPKMQKLRELTSLNKMTAQKVLSSLPHDFFEGNQSSSKLIYATKALTWLK